MQAASLGGISIPFVPKTPLRKDPINPRYHQNACIREHVKKSKQALDEESLHPCVITIRSEAVSALPPEHEAPLFLVGRLDIVA